MFLTGQPEYDMLGRKEGGRAMADKYEILKEHAEYLWEHGETRQISSYGRSETDDEKLLRMSRCKERAVQMFQHLGAFSPREVREPAVWQNMFTCLMATLRGVEPSLYYGEDFKTRASKLQRTTEVMDMVFSLGDRLLTLVITLVLGALAALIFFSRDGAMTETYRNLMIVACFILMLVGFYLAKLVGAVVVLVLTALFMWLVDISTAFRLIITALLAIPALFTLYMTVSHTRGSRLRRLRKEKTQAQYRDLYKQIQALDREVRPSLDALNEFASERCATDIYASICRGYVSRNKRTVEWSDGDVRTTESETHYGLGDAQGYASALIEHYQTPLDTLHASLQALQTHFQEAGVQFQDA